MIIMIRGTSGSGKSTVMREIMDSFGTPWDPAHVDGRKQPLWYSLGNLTVLGHYETACGGCDTIGSAKSVYNMITIMLKDKPNVLCEGLLLSEDTKWTLELAKQYEVRVVFLTTPLAVCIEQIKKRRAEAGNDKPLNTMNTEKRVAVIERARVKLLEAGLVCRRASPAQATGMVLRWLTLDNKSLQP